MKMNDLNAASVLMWLCGCALLFALQAWQVRRFLRANHGPPLTWLLVLPVLLIYLLTAGWLLTLLPSMPASTVLRATALLIMAVPLTLTDLRCQWLPMRYTVLFWLSGLLSAILPGAGLSWPEALTASLTAFGISAAVRGMANFRYHEERMGLGDVWLMAGLCAWLPWRSACYAAAGGLIVCYLCALITRQTQKPFAPALFGYLCGVCFFFPQQLAGVL